MHDEVRERERTNLKRESLRLDASKGVPLLIPPSQNRVGMDVDSGYVDYGYDLVRRDGLGGEAVHEIHLARYRSAPWCLFLWP